MAPVTILPASSSPGSCLANYTVRESAKAKNVRLQVSLSHGVEIIVPQGFAHNAVPAIVAKKQQWLERAIARMQERARLIERQGLPGLPPQIALRAIKEEWTIDYDQRQSQPRVTVEPATYRLVVQGDLANQVACQQALQRWLCRKAQVHLVPWLRSTSEHHQLPFGKTLVRGQKTRWASCSSRKTISLNYKLLFLPSPLVHYVFIHELSHTIHMNHGKQFWELVGTREPQYQELNRQLRHAWQYIPSWLG